MSGKSRPVFLNLLQIKFPVTAIISILHRVSGVVTIILLPFWLVFLKKLMVSPESYASLLASISQSFLLKLFLWLGVVSIWYHALAGLRHLVMDFGIAEEFHVAKITSWLLLLVTVVLSVFFIFKIWC